MTAQEALKYGLIDQFLVPDRMKNAVGYWIEPLLSQFFPIEAICRGFIDDVERKKIFEELADVFCVPMNAENH